MQINKIQPAVPGSTAGSVTSYLNTAVPGPQLLARVNFPLTLTAQAAQATNLLASTGEVFDLAIQAARQQLTSTAAASASTIPLLSDPAAYQISHIELIVPGSVAVTTANGPTNVTVSVGLCAKSTPTLAVGLGANTLVSLGAITIASNAGVTSELVARQCTLAASGLANLPARGTASSTATQFAVAYQVAFTGGASPTVSCTIPLEFLIFAEPINSI